MSWRRLQRMENLIIAGTVVIIGIELAVCGLAITLMVLGVRWLWLHI